MEKILVIAESINVEDSSGSKANVAFIKNLHEAGFELMVYHYTRQEIQLNAIPCFAIKENRRSLYFFLSRIERHLRKTLKLDIHRPLENLFGFSFTLFNDRDSIAKSVREFNDFTPDYILTLSKGGSFRPHQALLKIPELHSKWIAYMHDPYPMHLYPPPFAWVEAGQFKKWEFVKNISEKAAYTAFPSELLKDWMGSYFPEFLTNSIIIPHQISNIEYNDIKLPEFFDATKFNILHAGTLLEPRDPKPLVNAFIKLAQKFPESAVETNLIFIGKSANYQEWLQEKARALENLHIVSGGLSYETVRKLQDLASVNVILDAKSQISPFLPGKFPHCVEANKPILLLGPELSESKRLLGKNYPYWSQVTDENRITVVLEQMYLEWKNGAEGFRLNRKDLEQYLSHGHLRKVIKSLPQ
ncbi:UDP-glycosyltransferase [Christiangramia sp. ASW11-125]|uniref:UDP-glycosyltransferase n=1 Tax=Christiangramia sp. ASW11-125 TaxID=3400701 RepID=UPI003AAC2C22